MLNTDTSKVIKTNLVFSYFSLLDTKNLKKIELLEIPTETAMFYNTKDEEEILIVIRGNGGVIVNAESSLVKVGDVVRIPPNSSRSLANIEVDSLQVISMTTNL